MLNLKQCFCKHDFKLIAKHRQAQLNLWQCSKCLVWKTEHYGINVSYMSNKPDILIGWDISCQKL